MRAYLWLMAVAASGLVLQGQNTVSLLENSPFMPPGKAADGTGETESGPASLAKLQLRGITSIDGEYIFSIYNPDTRESKWVPQGVEQDGLLIKSFDPGGNSIVIHSESENLSRQMEMNDYSAPVGIRPVPVARPMAQSAPTSSTTTTPASPTGTLVRTQQAIQRPSRRNLETLRARRAELAEKLRKQPKPGSSDQNQAQAQGNGGGR